MAHTPTHAHISPRRVLIALTVTVLAAAVELVGSARGNTLFLAADACHLLAHVGIFGVLLIPTGQWHDRGEDVAATAVLTMVALIAVGYRLSVGPEPHQPAHRATGAVLHAALAPRSRRESHERVSLR